MRKNKVAETTEETPAIDKAFKPESTPGVQGKTTVLRDSKGHFIKATNALGQESTETHAHVAKVWSDKCTPFDALLTDLARQQEFKTDITVSEDYVRLDETGHLKGGELIVPSGLTSAVVKFAKGLPLAMANYLLKNDLSDLAKWFNYEMELEAKRWTDKKAGVDASKAARGATVDPNKVRQFLVRLREDAITHQQVARFIGSDRYGVIDNVRLAEMVAKALGTNQDVLVSHKFDNGDTMHFNLLLPDSMTTVENDSDYAVGISVGNSEVGRNTALVLVFLYRAICMNGCIWGMREMNIEERKNSKKKHVGEIDYALMQEDINKKVALALTRGDAVKAQMMLSKDVPIDEAIAPAIIAYLTRENKMKISTGRLWDKAFQMEPHMTAFGMLNGLTRAAQEFSGEERFAMEALAGDLLAPSLDYTLPLMTDQWERMAIAASRLKPNIVEKYSATRIGQAEEEDESTD